MCYWSKNIRAKFVITDKEKYDYLHLLYDLQKDDETKGIELAEELLKVLLENGFISVEQYDAEFDLLSKIGLAYADRDIRFNESVPFRDYYTDHLFDFIYDETVYAQNVSLSSSGKEWASVYLSCDKKVQIQRLV